MGFSAANTDHSLVRCKINSNRLKAAVILYCQQCQLGFEWNISTAQFAFRWAYLHYIILLHCRQSGLRPITSVPSKLLTVGLNGRLLISAFQFRLQFDDNIIINFENNWPIFITILFLLYCSQCFFFYLIILIVLGSLHYV